MLLCRLTMKKHKTKNFKNFEAASGAAATCIIFIISETNYLTWLVYHKASKVYKLLQPFSQRFKNRSLFLTPVQLVWAKVAPPPRLLHDQRDDDDNVDYDDNQQDYDDQVLVVHDVSFVTFTFACNTQHTHQPTNNSHSSAPTYGVFKFLI